MRVAITPKHNQATSDFLAAAQALPVLDMALATEAAAMPLLLDELQQAQEEEVNAPVQDLQAAAVADSSALATYVAPPLVEEPLLLAQASGGLGQTRSSSQGQVAGRAKPNGEEDDDDSAWWWLGGLGLLALGMSSSSSNDDHQSLTPYSINNDRINYNQTSTFETDDPTFSVKGREVRTSETGREFLLEWIDGTAESSYKFGISYDTSTKTLLIYDANYPAGGDGEDAFNYGNPYSQEAYSSFKAYVSKVLEDYAAAYAESGWAVWVATTGSGTGILTLNSALAIEIKSLDNQDGNSNFFNALSITYDGDSGFYLIADGGTFNTASNYFSSAELTDPNFLIDFDMVSYLQNPTVYADLLSDSGYQLLFGSYDADLAKAYDADPTKSGVQIFSYNALYGFSEITVIGGITDPAKLIQA